MTSLQVQRVYGAVSILRLLPTESLDTHYDEMVGGTGGFGRLIDSLMRALTHEDEMLVKQVRRQLRNVAFEVTVPTLKAALFGVVELLYADGECLNKV